MRHPPLSETCFADRRAAGRALAQRLKSFAHRNGVVVLALPRGGVVVGSEIARALNAPLDAFVVRKVGVPHHPELAMGAIADGGVRVLNEKVIEWYRVDRDTIEQLISDEQRKLARHERGYRQGRPPAPTTGSIVILVDDGVTTGSTMQAAIAAVRQQHPARVVVAVPVAAREAWDGLAAAADEVICLSTPDSFGALRDWYQDFPVTTEHQVCELLNDHFRGARSRAVGLPG